MGEITMLIYFISIQNKLLKFTESGSKYDSILLDFSRAFEGVDICISVHLMRDKYINRRMGEQIFNILFNRTMSVLCNNIISHTTDIIIVTGLRSQISPALNLIVAYLGIITNFGTLMSYIYIFRTRGVFIPNTLQNQVN